MLWYNLHVQVTACIDIIQYVNTFIIPMSNELHENIVHSNIQFVDIQGLQ